MHVAADFCNAYTLSIPHTYAVPPSGHRPTLEKDEHWANWFKWIDEQKLSVAEDQIPLPQPAPEAAEAPPAYPDIVLDSSSSAPPTPPNEELHPDDVMNNAVDQSAPIVQ